MKCTMGCDCEMCKTIQMAIRMAHDAKKRHCSLCKAKPGESCRKNTFGQRRPPHAERYAV